VNACAGGAVTFSSSSQRKEAPLTTFSWIWQLDTDMLMDSSSGGQDT